MQPSSRTSRSEAVAAGGGGGGGGLGAANRPAPNLWQWSTQAALPRRRGGEVGQEEGVEVRRDTHCLFFAGAHHTTVSDTTRGGEQHPFWLPLEEKEPHNPHRRPAWVASPALRTTAAPQAAAAACHLEEAELCAKVGENGRVSDAIHTLERILQRQQQGDRHRVSSHVLYRLLKRCIQDKDLAAGARVHALAAQCGHAGDAFLATHLIGLYASHGRLEAAAGVFAEVPAPDAHNWAAIILAHARHGGRDHALEAVRLYRRMCGGGGGQAAAVRPDNRLFSAVIKACAAAKDLGAGRQVHAQIVAGGAGTPPDGFVLAGLVDMYAKCGSLGAARALFDGIPERERGVVAWNAMIAGYARHGDGRAALQLYRSMRMRRQQVARPNSVTYVCVLQACASVGVAALGDGKQVHAEIRKQGLLLLLHPLHPHPQQQQQQQGVALAGSLVNMYAKCGSVREARRVFDALAPRSRSVVTWTALMAGYTQQGMGWEALALYRSMRQQQGLTPPNSVTFLCLLQACAAVGAAALEEGKRLHAHIKQLGLGLGLHRNGGGGERASLGVSLVNMYAKCGSVPAARAVFDSLPERSVVAWTAMIAGYVQQGMGEEALRLYRSMQQQEGGGGLARPDAFTYASVLQACASVGVGAHVQGKQLHARIKQLGLEKEDDAVLGSSLVHMHSKCGSVAEARAVLDSLSSRNVVTWTAMIAGYVQQGMSQEAITLYRRMQQESSLAPPDSVTYVCLLQACASLAALEEGKMLHAEILRDRRGLPEDDAVLGSSLVNMYAKCGSLDDARALFDSLVPQTRSVEAWNAMIAGYSQQGMGQEALTLFGTMRRQQQQQSLLVSPNSVTYVSVLQACASLGGVAGVLDEGKLVHADIKRQGLQEDVVLGCSLVNMYAKCGSLDDARTVFDQLPEKNTVAWNAMITGYAQQQQGGMGREALDLYSSMQDAGLTATPVTYVCLLQACASLGVEALCEGKQLHGEIRELGLDEDVVLGGSLVNMHAKCGNLEDARKVFDNLPERNIVGWNAMIGGYAQWGMGREALSLHGRMQREGGAAAPDSVTFVCLLLACASLGYEALDHGKQLHAQIREQGLQDELVLGVSLVSMYAKCGSIDDARMVFDKLPETSVVACNAMIAGYAQQGMGQEALRLYYSRTQQEDGLAPDAITYVSLLQACAAVAAMPVGAQLHQEIKDKGMQGDSFVGTAVVNMYAKCGSMFDAQLAFDALSERSVEAWGALLNGYARQGDSQVVFDLLDRMKAEDVAPNEMMLLSVLTVCSHAGLVDKGKEYFAAMSRDYGVTATVEHYICMVDLLGRARHLDEALRVAQTMPFPATDVVWHTLLGACRKWKNVEIGQQAFQGAVGSSVDGNDDAASYVLMANIYASAGMWEEAKRVQRRRRRLEVWKRPGQSWWTDDRGVVHTFGVGDKSHPESDRIYARLERVIREIKKGGYVPHLESSLLDVSDGEKEVELRGHSEKLAIAHALNQTSEGTTIRIVKNLRVCEDCHTATAHISKVENRTIICRDASRFHVFSDGKCSCGDYW